MTTAADDGSDGPGPSDGPGQSGGPGRSNEDGEPRTGVFRRLSGDTKGSATVFSAIEELFGPSKREARIEIEAQRRIGERAPTQGDPPYLILADPGDDADAAARFAGTVVIAPPAAQPDGAALPQEDRPVTDG